MQRGLLFPVSVRLTILCVLSFASFGRADERPSVDAAALRRVVEDQLEALGPGASASLWLGGVTGEPWFEWQSAATRPTASAIKTFHLVELFATYHDRLDAPLPGAARVLADDAHPAISHFAPEVQDEIRRELGSASVRRVGEIMIGKTPAPNAVYNAAANVVTAVLGGPERLTAAIHRRDAAFRTVHVRRYMLRDRTQPGDNEATATALAHLYRQLATHRLPGVDEPTVTAIRDVLWRPNDSPSGPHYAKFGRLRSDPLTEVRAGWQERPNGTVIYVVMLAQTGPGGRDRQAASQTLSQTAQKLATALLEAASQARTGIDE